MELLTRRLRLSAFDPEHWSDWLMLHGDPAVRRLMLDAPVTRPAHVALLLKWFERTCAAAHGIGLWRACLRDTSTFVGSFSLMPLHGTTDIEIGCLMRPLAWGRGLALEGALEVLRFGFAVGGHARILGLSHPENRPVQHCLRRLGFAGGGSATFYDQTVRVYILERTQWRGRLQPARSIEPIGRAQVPTAAAA